MLSAVCLNQTPLDWSGNLERISKALKSARQQQANLICFPELCISGYGCEDAFLSPDTEQRSLSALKEILPQTVGVAACFGLPLRFGQQLFNVVAFVYDQKILGFVAKQFLARDGIHYEPRWFQPWQAGRTEQIKVFSQEFAIGDLTFDLFNQRIGFEICEDAWVKDRPVHALAQRGVTIILNPSASHFAFGKLEVRKNLVLSASKQHNLIYVYSNLLGNEAGRAIYDGGALIARNGELIAQGKRFSFEDFEITNVAIASTHELAVESWEDSPELKYEEFTRAEALGLFDYMRKSSANGFVISLSGGADSTTVSLLVSYMIRLGVAELGVSSFCEKTKIKLDAAASIPELTSALLCLVYQATENSSETTRISARCVANAISATYYELEIQNLVEGYIAIVGKALGFTPNWNDHDVALQNIQARVRSPGVWMIANIKRALLLATSNRSEVALGYATMDGDTSGGLAPLGGIDKAFIREWLKWCQHKGVHGIGPSEFLSVVNQLEPTAELRPIERNQTDEADLMPYTVLDTIERAAVLEKLAPREVFLRLRRQLPDSASQIYIWVERFYRLFSQTQWKRERYAPSFHLDAENLDPRSWWRYPILSGCFKGELEELKQEIAREL